ncbi:MAG: hypothetical protein M3082_21635 [Candidatus Dormibacteraeota bacterium]|nr:hypothetical protein [Candidatus Dormibacteraeota bacterium]MDQ6900221.1 hypothetical protein [Candidatus Dormibacteraeota bacterium]
MGVSDRTVLELWRERVDSVLHDWTVALDVRRLAAVDMYGGAGTAVRRHLILAEFVIGTVGGIVIGLWVSIGAASTGWRLFGAWIAGIGVNYLPLALHAASLSRVGALDAELAGVDVAQELRRYTYLQFWIVVPLLLAALAVRQGRHRSSAGQGP